MKTSNDLLLGTSTVRPKRIGDVIKITYERSWYNVLIIVPIAVIVAGPMYFFLAWLDHDVTFTQWLGFTFGVPALWYLLVNLIFKQQGHITITSDTVMIGNDLVILKTDIAGIYIKQAKDFFTGGAGSSSSYLVYVPFGGDRVTRMGNALTGATAMMATTIGNSVENFGTSMWFKMNDLYVDSNYKVGFKVKGRDIKIAGGVSAKTADAIYEMLYKLP